MRKTKRLLCAALALLLCLPAVTALANPTFHVGGDPEKNRIAITIDDWWEPALIPEFLDAVAEYDCHLTLFPVGIILEPEDRELWQNVLDDGHELGNHSNTHKKLGDATRDTIIKQFQNMEKRLEKCLGYKHEMNTCRLPYGDGHRKGSGGAFARAIEAAGYAHVMYWTMDDNDSETILKKVKNGSVILLHANRHDLNTLREILPVIKERGFEMVTVSELFGLTKTGLIGEDTPE